MYDSDRAKPIARGELTGYQLPGFRAIRIDADEVRNKLKIIPTAHKPFGPRARILQAPADAVIEDADQDQHEAMAGGDR